MSPERYNLEGYRGDAISHGFRFLNDNGTPENLTGKTIIAQVRTNTKLDAPLLFAFTVSVPTPTSGEVTLTALPAVTAAIPEGSYAYDIQIGDTTRLYGTYRLIGDVSR